MPSHETPIAIYGAMAANLAIAVTKFGAAAYTGSGAMLAEAIHSVADCATQLLLLLGMRQARQPESVAIPSTPRPSQAWRGMRTAAPSAWAPRLSA